jgi:hypothetical protein
MEKLLGVGGKVFITVARLRVIRPAFVVNDVRHFEHGRQEGISKPATAVIVILSAAKPALERSEGNLGILGAIDPSLRSG